MERSYDRPTTSTLRHNRLNDVLASHTGVAAIRGIEVESSARSFEDYVAAMANCVVNEIRNADAERRMWDWYDEQEDKQAIMLDFLVRSIGMSREEQKAALDAMGEIAEQMQFGDGYDIVRVQDALSRALPEALNILREIRTVKHANATCPTMRGRGKPIVGPARADVKGTESVAVYLNRTRQRWR